MKKLIIFDLDGTLAKSKSAIDAEMAKLFNQLLDVAQVAIISGGDWPQFEKQVLDQLPKKTLLKKLSILPTCGTKFYQYKDDWKKLYAENFTADERKKILDSLHEAIKESGIEIKKTWGEKVPNAEIFPISALKNFNVPEVFSRIVEVLPESPAFYPKDQLTDKPERFFVNEIVREKILMHYNKEIPYSVEIETEEFIEDENIIRVRAIIMVERDSQKGIIIGHKGEALKRVGIEARADLEKFFGKQIHIELFVKVNKDWRSNQRQLKRFGYNN